MAGRISRWQSSAPGAQRATSALPTPTTESHVWELSACPRNTFSWLTAARDRQTKSHPSGNAPLPPHTPSGDNPAVPQGAPESFLPGRASPGGFDNNGTVSRDWDTPILGVTAALAACEVTNPTKLSPCNAPASPESGNKPSPATRDTVEALSTQREIRKVTKWDYFLWKINLDSHSREQCSHFPVLTQD